MKNKCKHCHSKVGEQYRVNSLAQVFCDDDCYEAYFEENEESAPDDASHPYIDDYEAVRFEFTEFLKWEEELKTLPANENIYLKIDEILDSIDSVIDEFYDYYLSEGDDGVFAKEIYQYIVKFNKLQRKILRYQPKRKVFFYLTIELDQGAFEEPIHHWKAFEKVLENMRENELIGLLDCNLNPNEEFSFYFYSKKILDEVLQKLQHAFKETLLSIYVAPSFRCDGCGDLCIFEEIENKKTDGWFFCPSCSRHRYPGFFSKNKLLKEIQLCDEDEDLLQRARKADWFYYIQKIKRSCRYHQVEFPDWIELKYGR